LFYRTKPTAGCSANGRRSLINGKIFGGKKLLNRKYVV
jgi:hypothetical protein